MELEQLRMFLAVAECRSFSGAARALFVSHSTTSRAVAALERELGVSLMHRTGRAEVTLTEEGEWLKPKAEEMLKLSEDIKKQIREWSKLHSAHMIRRKKYE